MDIYGRSAIVRQTILKVKIKVIMARSGMREYWKNVSQPDTKMILPYGIPA